MDNRTSVALPGRLGSSHAAPVALLFLTSLAASLLLASCGGKGSEDPGFLYGDARRLTSNGGSNPTWDPDGETIVYVNSGDLWEMPADGGDPAKIVAIEPACHDPEFLPHWGRQIVLFATGAEGEVRSLWRFNLNRDDPPVLLVESDRQILSPTWLRSGRQVAFVTPERSGVSIYDLDQRNITPLFREDGWESAVTFVAASPTEDILYFIETGESGRLLSIPTGGGEAREIAPIPESPTDHPIVYHSLAPNWDGTLLALAAGEAGHVPTAWAIWIVPSVGGDIIPCTDPLILPDCRNPCWSPDCTRLVFECGGQIWLVEIDS